MGFRCFLWFIIFAVFASKNTSLSADEILFRSGGSVHGTLLRSDDDFHLFKTDQGVTLKIERRQVERIRKPTPIQIRYAELAKDVDQDSIEDHLNMEKWCLKNRLLKERKPHLLHIIRLDPDHKHTRLLLGYAQRKDGRWLKHEHFYQEQGYVQLSTKWVPYEWKAIKEAQIAQRKEQSKWQAEVAKWQRWIDKGDQDLAIEKLEQVKNPMAVAAIGKAYGAEEDVDLRLAYIEALVRINTPAAQKILIISAINDRNRLIREACLTELRRQNSPGLRANFIRGLNPANSNNALINNSAIALGWLNAKEAVRPLIDALVTEHRRANPAAQPPGQIGANQSGSFKMGGKKPSVVVQKIKNRAVLQVLKGLTEQDFQYNTEAWLDWYAYVSTPATFDLRRNR